MGNKKCAIISAGDMNFCDKEQILSSNLIIACDGGYDNCKRFGIMPNLLIGDFDSIQSTIPEEIEKIKLNCEKDDTDTISAIRLAIAKKCDEITLYGALGGRLDHTYANIEALLFINENKCKGKIIGDNEEIFLIENEKISLTPQKDKTISIFCPDKNAIGVTLENMKYKLDNYTLQNSFPIGISNEFTDKTAQITVENGRLLIFLIKK